MDVTQQLLLLGKISLAIVLSGLVGFEREFAEKPAGFRTHMLVGGTASLLVMMGILIVQSFHPADRINADPIRIIEAIVVGISFLGAGTIIKNVRGEESFIEGLTTSASILSVSGIGIAVALDAYVIAVGMTILNLIINWALNYLSRYAKSKVSE